MSEEHVCGSDTPLRKQDFGIDSLLPGLLEEHACGSGAPLRKEDYGFDSPPRPEERALDTATPPEDNLTIDIPEHYGNLHLDLDMFPFPEEYLKILLPSPPQESRGLPPETGFLEDTDNSKSRIY